MAVSAHVSQRPFPYPFNAMLAITNDVDEASWDDFVLLHAFMNTDRRTPLGDGLALEVGDSFFFFGTESPAKRPTFTYFEGCTSRRSPWAAEMDALMASGYLDCLHSWGDFSRTGGFTRPLAEQAAPVLRDQKVTVWINHGDDRNEQKIGRAGWDDPGAPHGHGDIAAGAGLRYFWAGTLTSVVGQNARETVLDRLRPSRIVDEYVLPARRAARRDVNIVRFFHNRLMQPVRICGQSARVFQRYGSWNKPAATDLGSVIAPAVLDTLERRQGFMSVYTHLYRRPAGMPLKRVDWSPLRELARRHHRGTLQVTTTARMLRYAETRESVRWRASRVDNTDVIDIDATADDALQGLTFYVDDPDRASVRAAGATLRVQKNGPDGSGRTSISIPWARMRYPLAPERPAMTSRAAHA